MKKKNISRLFLSTALIFNCCAGFSAPAFAEESLGAITINDVNIEELFYKKHLNTEYSPIKLEASLNEPIDITVEDVMAKAIENNLNLKIAQQNSRAARWRFWNKFGDLLPDLSLNLGKQKRDGTFYLNSSFQAPIDETIASAGLRLNYRAFNGGASTFLALSERYMKQATDAKEQSQYNKTLLDSLTFYINLLNSQASLSSNLKSLERAKANYDLAETLLNGGKGTKFDLLQADARLAKAQQELIQQEAQFRVAEIDLAEHLNINLNSALHVADEQIKTISLIDESVEIEDYIKTAFTNNPDIKAVIKNKEAISRKSWSTLGAFLPSLDLYLDITGSGSEVSDLLRVTSLGFDLKYEIGQGLGVNAVSKTMESRADLNRAELEYVKELIRIEKALRNSYLNYQASKSLLEATQKEYIASKEAYRLSQLRYKNGIEILANMLDREADLKQSQLNLIKSASDYNLNQVKLVYNMGTINTKQILESGF